MKKFFSFVLLLLSLISCTHIAGDSVIAPQPLVVVGNKVCFVKDTRFLLWSFATEQDIHCR
ncbi:MAG: hypothetical protein Ta2D_12640 [Rickettsiales bacterium]|nr:MAG: hypothetical protein Ta2D_12640 [Rickettsiales bacterium]